MAAKQGLEATGVDSAPAAIEISRRKERERWLNARFRLRNALKLGSLGEQFDTVIDSGLFQVFGDGRRRAYVESLKTATAPGARYFMLCFSDQQPGDFEPRRIRKRSSRVSARGGG